MLTVAEIAKRHDEWLRIAIYLGADDDDAKDIVQDVYVNLCRIENEEGSLDRLLYNGQLNVGYMFVSINNKVKDIARYRSRFTQLNAQINAMADESTDIITEGAFVDLVEDVEGAMSRLHFYDEKLMRVYVGEDHSIRSLASVTKISPTSIHHSLKNIRTRLQQDTLITRDVYRALKGTIDLNTKLLTDG